MAVRLTRASSQYLSSSSPLNYNADYTIAGWMQFLNAASQWVTITELFGNGANLDILYRDGVTNKLHLFTNDAGVGTIDAQGATTITSSTVVFMAMVRSGNTLTVYIGASPNAVAQEIQGTSNPGSRVVAATTFRVGADETPANFGDIRWVGLSCWQRALTLDQLKNEACRITPADRNSLFAFYPLLQSGDYSDYSGNGRNLTATGTPTTEDNPPIPWGGRGVQVFGGAWRAEDFLTVQYGASVSRTPKAAPRLLTDGRLWPRPKDYHPNGQTS